MRRPLIHRCRLKVEKGSRRFSINSVPISIALVAGGLSVVNPCGFPLLPAFLSFYFGADEEQLPPASTRVVQGLVVGGLVALGFLGLFALVGLPVSFGVGAVARAVPWAGLATGALLAIVGLITLLGSTFGCRCTRGCLFGGSAA